MLESAKLIIMCAFGAYSFEISRSQLVSAAKHHIHENKRNIAKLEKLQLVEPLAAVFNITHAGSTDVFKSYLTLYCATQN